MALSPDGKIGPYELVEPLGKGGMGEVYRARDSKLKRDVAIKVLPEAFTTDAERVARFQREAEVLASLNHPNIAAIYGLEEARGSRCLILEFVDGETLHERILRGPASVDEALKIARQIAEGLESAHQKGVIHRDLKPANIKVNKQGQVKVLDFGLAKAFDTAPALDSANAPTMDAPATHTGIILGTTFYMSPEQAQGKSLDERSDIFSFGIVLYELLTGKRPFGGESTIDVLSAVVRDEPPPMQVSEPVSAIVRRCMAKRATDRFASMTEVKKALEQALKSSSQAKPSIAVLPFANMSGDKEQEYFSDGLAEEIINALAQVPDLKVIARTSAFAFKGQNTDVRKIAEALGVTSILEGSVRKAGNRIRVTAQLITAADGSHLWSQRFDREMEDVFAVQDEIAAAIAKALQVKLAVRAPKHQPSLPAYEAYLKYRHYQWGFTPESLKRSRECLEQAIALDPQFALPYVGLADFHIASASIGGIQSHEAMPHARALAQRALELDPDLSEAHAMLGIVAGNFDLDWKECERRFQIAMSASMPSCHLRQWYADFFLFSIGRTEEAQQWMAGVLEDDPLSQMWHCMSTLALSGLDRREESLAAARRSVELDPQFWLGKLYLGIRQEMAGQSVEALINLEQAHWSAPLCPYVLGSLAGILMNAGQTEKAERLLADLRRNANPSPGFAYFYLLRREIDEALEYAGRTVNERFFGFISLFVRTFEPTLRKSSKWPELLKKMNL
jgi:serine/threonine protein kinase/tetratricopeptide (TPR) repeat protein